MFHAIENSRAGNAVASGLPDLWLRLGLSSASSTSSPATNRWLCIISQPKLDIIMPSFCCFFFTFLLFCGYFRLTDLLLLSTQLKLMNFQADSGGNPLHTTYDTIFTLSVIWQPTQHLRIRYSLFFIPYFVSFQIECKSATIAKIEQPKQRKQQQRIQSKKTTTTAARKRNKKLQK